MEARYKDAMDILNTLITGNQHIDKEYTRITDCEKMFVIAK